MPVKIQNAPHSPPCHPCHIFPAYQKRNQPHALSNVHKPHVNPRCLQTRTYPSAKTRKTRDHAAAAPQTPGGPYSTLDIAVPPDLKPQPHREEYTTQCGRRMSPSKLQCDAENPTQQNGAAMTQTNPAQGKNREENRAAG
jgi:hypothetical protein